MSRSRRSTGRRLEVIALAAVLAVAVAVTGCGSGDEDNGSDGSAAVDAQNEEVEKAGEITTPIDASDVVETFPPQVVTDGDVEAEKNGTPERAFLEWWQAFQFHDFEGVEALTSEPTSEAIGAGPMEELVNNTGLQGVEVLDVTASGSSAQINAGLLNFQPPGPGKPPPRKPTNSTPETFTMAKEDGDWVFDDTDYLQLKVDALSR